MNKSIDVRKNLMSIRQSRVPFMGSRLAYVFLIPIAVLIIAFMFFPMISSISMSLFNENSNFVGFDNYKLTFTEARFIKNLQLSLIYVTLNVSLSIVLGLLAAHLITEKSKFVNIIRPLYLIPWVIPEVSSAILFRNIFDGAVGPVTVALKELTGKNYIFLAKPVSSLVIVILHNFWRSFPFAMIFIAAGLTVIPKFLYEAADIDGATKWQQFRWITLPLLKTHLFIVTLMITNWTLQDAETVYSLTQGGPGISTEMLAVRLFKDAFVYFDVNTGAVLGVILLIIAIIFMFIYNNIIKVKEEGEVSE